MKPLFYLLPTLLLSTSLGESPRESAEHIATENNVFAGKLYREIAKKEEGNIFFSPFSISTALAMTYAGADADTELEMKQALNFGDNDEAFHKSYGDYLTQLEKNRGDKVSLEIANRLWSEFTFQLDGDFQKINADFYNSKVEGVNFKVEPDKSRVKINNWVAEKTKDKIKDLLPSGSITRDTRLVLTNAIYFKADWATTFDDSLTKKDEFTLVSGKKAKADFMNSTANHRYYETADFKALHMPYDGKKQSMIVVLPHRVKDIDKLENVDINEVLTNVLQSRPTEVEVKFPKFKMTQPISLKPHLKALGMVHAFADSEKPANFSKMTKGKENLAISEVFHKAFIEVDEKGTEAAAATAVVMVELSEAPSTKFPPKQFKADHPFLFYIIDNETQAVLFMGRIMKPS